jgi:nucleoside phosphorylase
MTARRVFIYCALPCEAAPLIAHFKLKKDISIWPFAVYCNHDICLTVSGLGKNAMAAAVAFSQARLAVIEPPVMINVGIAGHKDYDLGSVWLIDKITDADTQKHYYPPLVFSPPCPTSGIKTVSIPQSDYLHSELCDMESSAFYETAIRFTTGELVQCLKVISDNSLSPLANIRPKQVSAWIAEQLPVIETLLASLRGLAETVSVSEPPLFAELLQRMHFTANEQIQLKNLICRWQVLNSQEALVFDKSLQKARDILQWLERAVNSSAFCL